MDNKENNANIGILGHIKHMQENNEIKVFAVTSNEDMLIHMYKEIKNTNQPDHIFRLPIINDGVKIFVSGTSDYFTELALSNKICSETGLIIIGKAPDIIDEFQNQIEINKVNFELTRIHEIEDCYIPSFKKTRKDKKQEYHFNHRKNWRKRK